MCTDVRKNLTDYMTENREAFYRLAYSYVRNREAALDIVQNAIVKGLENYATIRKPEFIKTWFYRILVNECLSYLRKNKREYSYEPEMLNSLLEGSQEEKVSFGVYEQVLKLQDKMKTVIILRFYEEMKLEEISRVTGTGLSTVKYRLYAGLKKIEKGLKEGAE